LQSRITMHRILVVLTLAVCAFGQKKPVTISAASTPTGGGRGDRTGAPIWSPDGKGFAYVDGKKLMFFEAATSRRSELASIEAIEKMAVKPPAREQFEFINRGVTEDRFQWSGDAKSLLAIESGDIFLYSVPDKKWTQLTATAEQERDPRLSP